MDSTISFEKVNYLYQPNTPFESRALFDIDFNVAHKDFIALVGHTGSGKSTLIQQINGLLIPTSGSVMINDIILNLKTAVKQIDGVKKIVGMVFQQPENQLFEETVEKDIVFGPRNFGVPEAELHQLAIDSLKMVGLSEKLLKRSPFELSGGQMRRVAIAGILAIHPQILVLDEPTAGLDPVGQADIMNLVEKLRTKYGTTVVLVTHQMELVAEFANRVIVLSHGKLKFNGTPRELFNAPGLLTKMNLAVPQTISFVDRLTSAGIKLDSFPLTPDELTMALMDKINFKMSGENE
ncbi:energy-coupling factor transporter ATPase [Nicoliella spurrieriana]|uniref:Energy-coupling factor transporter ATP-binding protein EcfA2 n=1 Tax=Nicoliella spurrieriana TaxID=2925830 RepID=A0A976RR62_9LACO|nr:energy-coupling factor transporter ATPase [Nicoliella spurrieriana]UQS86375.1 energy-coupling factor transporter ATPase [Nicoliella spurrieriana]